jgi:hypothetical protein
MVSQKPLTTNKHQKFEEERNSLGEIYAKKTTKFWAFVSIWLLIIGRYTRKVCFKFVLDWPKVLNKDNYKLQCEAKLVNVLCIKVPFLFSKNHKEGPRRFFK